jgi:hypothetical protein
MAQADGARVWATISIVEVVVGVGKDFGMGDSHHLGEGKESQLLVYETRCQNEG